ANHPNAVIARFERGRYAHDEECLQAYVIALARVGQSDKILPKIVEKLEQLNIEGGNKENPIYVVVDEARGYIFWRALRWLGITLTYAFCIFTFLSIAMENSGLLKTGG
ncbi:2187_t:CDS:2, partial [Entrophospora sp. SA101]